ncbi:MAG TPA: epoxyqueuosine reductase QueH [Candidatus Wallbacteria bacterium]|nr:epoxyqueuosine reductase QueH [Candidatus Wallbacteria bacterium]
MKVPEKIDKKTLLHICCAPCAAPALFDLSGNDYLTGFFYNPNIHPDEEYEKRLGELPKISEIFKTPYVTIRSDYSVFLQFIKGLEQEPEGGARCVKCFELRLEKAFKYASQNGFSYVGTTLSTSPHKNVKVINSIGNAIAERYENIKFMEFDFKKKDGFKKSVLLCEKYFIYRQKYCGCHFSKISREKI